MILKIVMMAIKLSMMVVIIANFNVKNSVQSVLMENVLNAQLMDIIWISIHKLVKNSVTMGL